jgi:AraC family transcriptional regulator
MNSPVESAITHMWERYSEPMSLADIAKSAILSRFHFCRVFREATGVSPGRFLSAVRIYQARRLLASSTMSVTEISLAVGYNSLGSFTNHFTDSVGISPSRFRRLWAEGIREVPAASPASDDTGSVTGMVELPPDYASARAYVGVFPTPLIQRRPFAWEILDVTADSQASGGPASYSLANVPPGTWHVKAVAEADSSDPEPWTRRSLLVGGQGMVTVTPRSVSQVDITLRTRRPTDLPILFAVPNLSRSDTSGTAVAPVQQFTAELAAAGEHIA